MSQPSCHSAHLEKIERDNFDDKNFTLVVQDRIFLSEKCPSLLPFLYFTFFHQHTLCSLF